LVSFVIRRLIQTVIVIVLVTFITFMLLQLVPGDPVRAMLGLESSPEQIEVLRHQLWLDRPVLVQYWHWISNAVRGDLGSSISISSNEKVVDIIGQRLPITLYVSLWAFLLSPILGVALGAWGAIRRGKFIDPFISIFANIGVAIPIFWLAILGAWLFGFKLHWLAIQGFTFPTDDLVKSIKQTVLPVICLSIPAVAMMARQARSSVLEVIRQEYVRTAMAKGLRERRVVMRHVLKNAMIPVVTLLGLEVRILFGGAVVVEQVFNINGMGRMMVNAGFGKDFPVLQGGVLVIGLAISLANLIVDLSYGWLDPRIKYE
jgi:peptide/nickel transport system permease protein